jgi:hypothetical protein
MGGAEMDEERISWCKHSRGRWRVQLTVKTPSGPRVLRTTKPTLEEAYRWVSEQRAKHGE